MKAKIIGTPLGLSEWTIAPAFQEKVAIEGNPSTIYLTGMQATHAQHGEMIGSAASLFSFPEKNAYYELIERIAIVESMARPRFVLRHETNGHIVGEVAGDLVFPPSSSEQIRHAKSNGVALYSNWPEACRRAAMELVERHLILASWLGMTKPALMRGVAKSPLHGLSSLYSVEHYDFGQQKVSSLPTALYVTGVILKPRVASAPLILGCGAGQSQAESIQKAEGETWQRLGFLWGEEIPQEEPEFAAHQLYHQEFYLYPKNHARIEAWLRGDFYEERKARSWPLLHMSFADLSIEGAADFRVAKALAAEAIPLVFGLNREGYFADLDEERLIHPIA